MRFRGVLFGLGVLLLVGCSKAETPASPAESVPDSAVVRVPQGWSVEREANEDTMVIESAVPGEYTWISRAGAELQLGGERIAKDAWYVAKANQAGTRVVVVQQPDGSEITGARVLLDGGVLLVLDRGGEVTLAVIPPSFDAVQSSTARVNVDGVSDIGLLGDGRVLLRDDAGVVAVSVKEITDGVVGSAARLDAPISSVAVSHGGDVFAAGCRATMIPTARGAFKPSAGTCYVLKASSDLKAWEFALDYTPSADAGVQLQFHGNSVFSARPARGEAAAVWFNSAGAVIDEPKWVSGSEVRAAPSGDGSVVLNADGSTAYVRGGSMLWSVAERAEVAWEHGYVVAQSEGASVRAEYRVAGTPGG